MLCSRTRLLAPRLPLVPRVATLATHTAPLPTIEAARAMPTNVQDLSGESLFILAEGAEHPGARRERMRREIMVVDEVAYEATGERLKEISALAASRHAIYKSPYQLGIFSALLGGWFSLPLVFHFGSASKFNDLFVTAEPPEHGEADTWLEVGSWSWNWMEPPLGTISFFLLCMQFAREQRERIGVKHFTEKIRERQGDDLVAAFPQYDAAIVRAYAEAIALQSDFECVAANSSFCRLGSCPPAFLTLPPLRSLAGRLKTRKRTSKSGWSRAEYELRACLRLCDLDSCVRDGRT